MGFWDTFKFSVVELVDLLLVAILLFYLYKLVKGTVAINIFAGIVMVYLILTLDLHFGESFDTFDMLVVFSEIL